MTKLSKTNWTRYARNVLSAQSKIANELLEVAEAEGNGAVAGPQEVVDAIEEIVGQLEEVQEAIPAEPAGQEGLEVEAGVPLEAEPEAIEAPVVEEEEEELVAKLRSQVAALTHKVDAQEREKVAQSYSDLYDDVKVAQAKFDEVIASRDSVPSWKARIAAIQNYRTETKGDSQYVSPTSTSGFLSRSKVAKLSSEFTHL
tara:strand:- start:1344 stop:1943 length:600 start_codon:yes stop_codon:yes gene_type:complete